ncbi:A/G-specific adenine glycosylase [Flavobacteriaceae bacterium]|nr:A/G-specific adenine glycosylase [Flavobacteriaceae bacterium]
MSFNSTLVSWYSENKRDLPWRNSKTPYNIWLSEIILQQTQVKQGLPYYKKFISNFPTLYDLASASEIEILKLWQGLGYYSRARNLHFSAKYITKELNGVFPKTKKELLLLKGVGDYTASAIASICYEEAVAVVDGNVYRVLARYFGVDTPINSSKGIKQFKALATSLLPNSNLGDYNQAIMEFGAKQCKPISPLCMKCPLNADCMAYATGSTKILPVKLKKTKITKKHFNFIVLNSEGSETYIEQRKNKGIWQQLYQFPLIETNKPAVLKDLMEHSKAPLIFPETFTELLLFNNTEIVHKLSHLELYVKFWILKTSTPIKNTVKWSDIKSYPVPVVIERFINNFQN